MLQVSIFFHGAIAMGCLAVALYFVRIWRRLGDRLFAFLAASFVLLAVERVVLASTPRDFEGRPLVFLIRLVAFALIIIAVLDKNRLKGRSGTAR